VSVYVCKHVCMCANMYEHKLMSGLGQFYRQLVSISF